MELLKPHSPQSLVLPRLTFLSILIFLCLIIVFWLWTVSLILDWYLPALWPSYLPWYSALVSPLISLLPLLTTACTTVLTLIKNANGSLLCWLIYIYFFFYHIHNYTEYIQQWNLCSAFNPSKCTHTWSSEQPTLRRSGSIWGFGALLKGLTSVVDNFCRSRDSNPQPWITSPMLYPLGHDCPLITYHIYSGGGNELQLLTLL